MIDYKQIGKRIAKRRDVLDMTQAELAEKALLSATYTGNVERGAKCSIETLMKLCAALGVTPDYLLLGVDKEYRSDSLEDVKDAIFRCSPRKKKVVKSFIEWYAEQDV
ncbi:MAG: helix-turn-helix domain-containing protein [Peptococcaceae bacterium]|nr:helix-turn-helix domain-containing protein [Peptococcaceae bacterium]